MPSHRTKLTLILPLLLVLSPVSAGAAGESTAEGGSEGGQDYSKSDSGFAPASSLRQTMRLNLSRLGAADMPSAPIEPQISARTVAAEDVLLDSVSGVSDHGLMQVSANAPQGSSEAAARIMELTQRGMLTPEMAGDLLNKFGVDPGVSSPEPAGFVQAVPAPKASIAAGPVSPPDEGSKATLDAASGPGIARADGVAEAPSLTSPAFAERQPAPQATLLPASNVVLTEASSAPVPDTAPVKTEPQGWVLGRDDRTVRNSLERWSKEANWQFAWEYPVDFQIEFDAKFDGDFIDAVSKVVDGIAGPDRPVRAEFYFGNRVLRIVSGRGE